MSNIRVTYSGLIAFIVSLVTVITGTIFVIMVTRRLSPEDLGMWTLIGSLISYVIIIRPMITYWSTRQLSRGEEIGKTTLFTSGLFSIAGSIAYVGFAMYFAFTTNADLNVLLLATFLIPLSFLHNAINSIGIARRPQSVSYGLIIFEVTKIPMGLLLVVIFDLEIVGAIVTTIVAELSRLIFVSLMIKNELRGQIKIENIKFWLRMSWLTFYQTGSRFLRSFDVFLFTALTGSFTALAYWGVSQTVGTLVTHSEKLTQGLYPKLIATKQKEFAEQALNRTFLFAIPTLSLSIIFVKPILHILNPIYVDGFLIAILLSIRSFMFMFNNISFEILRAFDPVDENKQTAVKQYLKSKLFLLPTYYYIAHAIYISALVVYLIFLQESTTTDLDLVTVWSFLYVAVSIPLTAYGIIAIKVQHQVQLPFKSITKYSSIAIFSSGIIYIILENFIIYHESVYDFIPQLIPVMLLFVGLYFGISYVTDKQTRKLFELVFNEIKKVKK